jgi:hypothetical protein
MGNEMVHIVPMRQQSYGSPTRDHLKATDPSMGDYNVGEDCIYVFPNFFGNVLIEKFTWMYYVSRQDH